MAESVSLLLRGRYSCGRRLTTEHVVKTVGAAARSKRIHGGEDRYLVDVMLAEHRPFAVRCGVAPRKQQTARPSRGFFPLRFGRQALSL